MPRVVRKQEGFHLAAVAVCQPAAGVEAASAGGSDGAGHIALEDDVLHLSNLALYWFSGFHLFN